MGGKEFTIEEVRKLFLAQVVEIENYWANLESKTKKEAIQGAMFSLLAVLDGNSINLPQFVLAPDPHEDDQRCRIDEGNKYFPEMEEDIYCDISGSLHESIHEIRNKLNKGELII